MLVIAVLRPSMVSHIVLVRLIALALSEWDSIRLEQVDYVILSDGEEP